MTLPIFLELVEMKAKTASVLPFLIGICYSYYYYHSIHVIFLLLFFVAMFLFNMFVDIWDNYNDYHKAVDSDYQENTNIIGRENLSLKMVSILMYSMLILAGVLGLILCYFVGFPLLIMGVFCFAVGILYSFGPKPLSSLPLGEFFSGFTMGFMITLICVYINTNNVFTWDLPSLVRVLLIALPNTVWIANLMLANNLCDKEEDEKNHRYTIVRYLGTKTSLGIFVIANIIAFVSIFLEYYFHLAPITILASFLLIPFVVKQTKMLIDKQVKRETFSCAVRILALGSFVQALTYFIGIIF